MRKLASMLGFWTKRQIADQHVSTHAGWQNEHREWMKAHDLKPLTFD